MKRNAFQFRRANEEDLPEICRIVKLAGESVPVKEWFEAEDEEFLAKHIREEGFTLLAKKNGQTAACTFPVFCITRQIGRAHV